MVGAIVGVFFFFFSSRRRHTRCSRDWSSDVCSSDLRAAVIEVGTNHPGELAPLVQMVAPNYGVITSIGREHLEFFGDLTGVAQEQGWLAELLPETGTLFVTGDNPESFRGTAGIVQRSHARLVRVGFSDANDWRARGLRIDKQGATFR